MSDFAWHDVLDDDPVLDFESDPVPATTTKLPNDNEGKPELEEQGQPAAGDLPEDDKDPGMHDVPQGTDPNTGLKSGDYDDVVNELTDDFEDKADESDDEKEEGEDDKGDDEDKKDDESKDEGKEEDTKDVFTDTFTDFDEDTTDFYDFESDDPGQPKTDLPKDNEGKPEMEEQDFPAAGDLPENEKDPGMKDVPDGTDPNNGMKSTEYDDVVHGFMDEDDEEGAKDQGEDEGSDDDGASKDGDTKGDDDKDDKKDDEEEVKDFADFFVDADVVEPEGLPAGNGAEPADPVDQNGDDVCPIGDPDLPKTLTEPVKVPVAGPAKDSADADARFAFFGDF